jgi:hypothetical protein
MRPKPLQEPGLMSLLRPHSHTRPFGPGWAFVLAGAIFMLAACGGGDCDEDCQRTDTQPVQCELYPERCR